MPIPILYKSSRFYHSALAVAYGTHRKERFEAVARWVPEQAEVLDVCCGDGTLATYLPASVRYRGVDMSAAFVRTAHQHGRRVELFDLTRDPLPRAQVVICQVSLFQFYPSVAGILAKLFEAAEERLIISESVRSLTQSRWPWIAAVVAWGTRVNGLASAYFRFTPESLQELFHSYGVHVTHVEEVCAGRDWVFVLDKA